MAQNEHFSADKFEIFFKDVKISEELLTFQKFLPPKNLSLKDPDNVYILYFNDGSNSEITATTAYDAYNNNSSKQIDKIVKKIVSLQCVMQTTDFNPSKPN
jgi:hypothetical protein